MSLPVSLLKVLPTFKNTFESVDLRVAAVFQEGQWKNAISVFRLSHEPAENIRRRQQELQLIFGEVHGNALRFHFDVLASDKIQELIVAIQSGNLQVNGNSVTFGEVESFETQLASIDRGGMSIEGQEWSMYRSGYGQYQYQLLQSSSVLEEAHAYGASGPNELLNALFEEQLFAGGYPDRAVFFRVPVYIRIADFSFERVGISIVVERHKNIDVPPKVLLLRNDSGRYTPTQAIPIEKKSTNLVPGTSALVLTRYEGQRPAGVGTWLSVGISVTGIGEVQKESRSIASLIPLEETSPLYAALQRFCSRSDFGHQILQAHERQPGKLKVSSAFELHISWLLSLVGLTPVVLGDYEKLFAINTDFHHGSIDILAMNPATKTIFVIDCTLVVPPAHDYSKVLTAKSVLKNEVLKPDAHVQAMLFTTTRDVVRPDEVGKTPEVIVIDGNRLRRILEMLESGQQDRVLAYFENPAWTIF